MANYEEVTFDGIEEGELAAELDELLRKTGRALARYRETYGDRATGAKGTVTLKISFKIEKADDALFSIKSSLGASLPSRPERATIAIEMADQEGMPGLFARQSGTDETHPAQSKLCTQDGRAIDLETGAVESKGTQKAKG
jgi:hypothetical protein